MKQFLTLLMLLWLTSSYAQKYSYQFKGNLSPENQVTLLAKIEAWNYYQEVKLLVKENSGEILFVIPTKSKRTEEEAPVSVTDLKALILSYGLEPSAFIELEN
ncbi:MAG: hypothetical protein ACOVO3_11240 [Fluviicola sp.]|jgi:hypothetical protein